MVDLTPFYAVNEHGCWLWTGAVRENGYGSWGGANAHRIFYEILVGPVSEGLHVDHLCRVRLCVNPAHLEAVPIAENVRRGESPSAQNARKTHCMRGHPLSGSNLRIYAGKRQCGTCHTDRVRKAREKKRMATPTVHNTD